MGGLAPDDPEDEDLRSGARLLRRREDSSDQGLGPHGATADIAKRVRERLLMQPIATRIARYTMLKQIGSGGMGTVYAAYDGQLDRKVAVKVLREGELLTNRERGRFVREARALARLSHPNVVAVYEVGEADDQLFLAMEFIRGKDLAQWLEHTKPHWREALEVFIQAGHGLSAVHKAGLVHRDLKPHNIMRSSDGLVKLLDFGLARALEGIERPLDGSEFSSTYMGGPVTDELTHPGTVIGTPAYMSPEQIDGDPVDARSDQFSFCVALYEAVYRQRPFPGESVSAIREGLRRGQLRPIPKGITVPARLRTAILRGLAKEPRARWPTMDALLKDLQRVAVPRRKSRIVLGIGGTVVAGLTLAWGGNFGRADKRCAGASAQLEGIWDEARRQQVEASMLGTAAASATDAWARVATRLDGYASTWMDRYTEVCEATVIRQEQPEAARRLRVRCLETRRIALRAVVDVLAQADEGVMRNAVELASRLPDLRRCDDLPWLEQRDRFIPPPEDPIAAAEVARLREQLAEVAAKNRAGRYIEALEQVGEIVPQAEALAHPPLIAEALRSRGELLKKNGAYEASEASLHQAYQLAMGHGHDDVALNAAQGMAFLMAFQLAKPEKAALWAEEIALPLAQRSGNEIEVAESLSILGALNSARFDYEVALGYFQRALEIRERRLGVNNLEVISDLGNLGSIYLSLGRLADAETYLRQAAETGERVLGADHMMVSGPILNLGELYFQQRRYDDARYYLERAIEGMTRSGGPNHPNLAYPLFHLGSVCAAEGRYEDAHRHLERALALIRSAQGDEHPMLASIHQQIASAYSEQQRYAEAKVHFRRAKEIWGVQPDRNGLLVGYPELGIAEAQLGLGDARGARAHAQRAIELLTEYEPTDTALVEARFVLARALWSEPAERDRARQLVKQARTELKAMRNEGGDSQELIGKIDHWLAAHPVAR